MVSCYIFCSHRISLPKRALDGSIIKGPNGEKFKASYDKYEATVDAYQKRGQQIQSKIGEAKLALQKKNASIKQAQRNLATLTNTIKKREQVLQQVKSGSLRLHQIEGMDSFSARVKWHTAALDATAGKRRAELLHKRNSNSSKTWDQTFPGLSSMLKRSLYFKMHRRRQQIVLRPSFTSTVTDLRQIIERKHAESSKKGNVSTEAVDADVQAAEQRYLLATHTLAPRGGKVPSVPNSNGWAEPGQCLRFRAQQLVVSVSASKVCLFLLIVCDVLSTYRLSSRSRCSIADR